MGRRAIGRHVVGSEERSPLPSSQLSLFTKQRRNSRGNDTTYLVDVLHPFRCATRCGGSVCGWFKREPERDGVYIFTRKNKEQ